MRNVVLYRGPLERSRVAFLLEAMRSLVPKFDFIWIFPGQLSDERRARFDEFIAEFGCQHIQVFEDSWRQVFRTRADLRKVLGGEVHLLMAIGFSAKYFIPKRAARHTIWCINGIPEEEDLTLGRRFDWAPIKWRLTQIGRPDVIITVSTPMSAQIMRYHRKCRYIVAPTCVDLSVFQGVSRGADVPRQLFGYLGTGADWQALDLLSDLWRAIHLLDPTVRFRVISRDPRTRILATGINPANIEFVGSEQFGDVARLLSECQAGFLLRRAELVNQVSFPTKLGEYIASGAWVVTSSINWDVERFVDENECGIVLNPGQSSEASACAILDFRDAVSSGRANLDLARAARLLDREHWVQSTVAAIRSSVPGL